MLLFVPLSAALVYVWNAPPLWVFISSVLAIVPLAVWIRRAPNTCPT
jgi:Ca2+:H+ antiporter